jgi:RimJ/RimL family protein N-acetyltransferase
MTAPISSSNKRSIKFVEHLGFTLEATLKDACKDGDMLLYSMTKEKCRWLTRPQTLPRILNNG